jgi:phospholipid/cholesterol/gamma-HCH transport system substrate-binding protein
MRGRRTGGPIAYIRQTRRAGIDAPQRHLINVTVFLILASILIVYILLSLLFIRGAGRTLKVEAATASGIDRLNDVTMRGVPVGIVGSVELTPRGTATIEVILDAGVTVPSGTKAAIVRRTAIGDPTMDLSPGAGPPLPNGGRIPLSDTSSPPDPGRTIEVLAQVLHSVPSEDLTTVISELATAVRGRGEDLATLSEASADLPEAMLSVKEELESLIVNGPKVTSVLATNADTLADDLAQTAVLADILRDERFNLRDLSENGANFAEVATDLIVKDKANLACLLSDLGQLNATMARRENLANLKRTLENNHYFFDGVWLAVQHGRDGLDWFRVQLTFPPSQPPGNAYEPNRPTPDAFGGNACRSIYGQGVGPATQSQPVHLAPGSTVHPGS